MTERVPSTCAGCGAVASGNFCAACGAPLATPTCGPCGATLSAGAKFCHACGAGTTRATASGGDRTAWIIAAILVAAIIVAVGYSATKRGQPEVPNMANAGNAGALDPKSGTTAPAPNIENLSPKERFIRLQTRIDQQIEKGDTTRLAFFIEMALGAYGLLAESDRDIDVRFHAAMLQAEAGMLPGARALADTIMTKSPDNLLAYYVRATVAESAGDSAQAKSARAAFRAHFATEMTKKRPEYEAHRPFLEQYVKAGGAN